MKGYMKFVVVISLFVGLIGTMPRSSSDGMSGSRIVGADIAGHHFGPEGAQLLFTVIIAACVFTLLSLPVFIITMDEWQKKMKSKRWFVVFELLFIIFSVVAVILTLPYVVKG